MEQPSDNLTEESIWGCRTRNLRSRPIHHLNMAVSLHGTGLRSNEMIVPDLAALKQSSKMSNLRGRTKRGKTDQKVTQIQAASSMIL